MILGKDIHPEREIYYLGAIVIETIKELGSENTLLDLFHHVNIKNKTSMNLFMLTLDWLFIIGLVRYKNGYIRKCF